MSDLPEPNSRTPDSAGEATGEESAAVARVVKAHLEAIQMIDNEDRIVALEGAGASESEQKRFSSGFCTGFAGFSRANRRRRTGFSSISAVSAGGGRFRNRENRQSGRAPNPCPFAGSRLI